MAVPNQGQWSEADYLSPTDNSRHLVELVEGRVEVLRVDIKTLLHSCFLRCASLSGLGSWGG
jgi:hypothetical protein